MQSGRESMVVDRLLIEATLFVICLIFSGFFSGSEVALISINRAKVRALVSRRVAGSDALQKLKKSTDHTLITILIGNNVVNVAAAALATAIAIEWFGDAGIGIATGVVVILMLIFGEIGPKTYAARHVEKIALMVSRPIFILSRLISPVFWVRDWFWRTSIAGRVSKPAVTEEEIKEWIDAGEEEGAIEQDERQMLYSVLRFSDTTAREIMCPRVDVVVIEDTSSLDDSLTIFSETGFSRIPVYHEHIDNIAGLLNIKDVFAAVMSGRGGTSIKDTMYVPYFIPESKKIDDLLRELQVKKVHMAMVLDEYGSFAGIVTIEDILEEIVGEIMDEFDQEEPEIEKVGRGVYLVDATTRVEHVNEELSIDLPIEESYETIGGLIIERLGHIPRRGERVMIEESGIMLVVAQMRGLRMVKVSMTLPAQDEQGA